MKEPDFNLTGLELIDVRAPHRMDSEEETRVAVQECKECGKDFVVVYRSLDTTTWSTHCNTCRRKLAATYCKE